MSPRDGLKRMIERVIGTQPRYEVVYSQRGPTIKLDGKEILASSVLDMSFIDFSDYTPAEVAVIEELDELVRIQSFDKKRRYSGLPEYTHPAGVVEIGWKNYREGGTLPHFRSMIVHLGHDYIENEEALRDMLDEWENLLHKEDKTDADSHSIEQLERVMGVLREELKSWLTERLIESIPGGTVNGERRGLEKKIEQSVNSIYGMTRSTESEFYAVSTGTVYRRRGREDFALMLMRDIGKNGDRTRNSIEYGPMYSPEIASQLNHAFTSTKPFGNDSTLGKELESRFGNVSVNGKMMEPPIMVMTAFNSILALHYQNEAIARYGVQIASGSNPRARELLPVLEASKRGVIDSAIGLLQKAVEIYEERFPSEKAKMDRVVARQRKNGFYNSLEPNGPFEYWARLDAKGRKKVANEDRTEEQQIKVYRDARHFIETFRNFRMAREGANLVEYLGDPIKQTPFTLKGVEKAIQLLGSYRRAKEMSR